jgi:aerobic carbon-monoxide dehydrogenase medium subunit
VIPAAFDYVRPGSVDEAVGALTEHGDEAKVLAGGQSLIPLLRLRLAYPSVLVDVGRLAELRGVRDDGDGLVVGAATPHHEVMTDPLVRAHLPLVAEATATVADPAVRHRGTFGGALAHAGRRQVLAAHFFQDYLQTDLGPDELLVSVRLPKPGPGWGHRYEKFHRVAQAWAVVGVAALVRRDDGRVAEARVALTNMGTTPVRAAAVEAAAAGAEASVAALTAAAENAPEGTDPPADLNAQPDYRQHLSRVLTRRALVAAAGA